MSINKARNSAYQDSTENLILILSYDQLITEIENAGVVFAVNSGVASTKCRQICSGAVYRGRGKNRVAEWIHDEKIEELSQLIDELRGRPCLIAYVYDHERVRIQKAMKIPHIGGGVSDKRAKELEDELILRTSDFCYVMIKR